MLCHSTCFIRIIIIIILHHTLFLYELLLLVVVGEVVVLCIIYYAFLCIINKFHWPILKLQKSSDFMGKNLLFLPQSLIPNQLLNLSVYTLKIIQWVSYPVNELFWLYDSGNSFMHLFWIEFWTIITNEKLIDIKI